MHTFRLTAAFLLMFIVAPAVLVFGMFAAALQVPRPGAWVWLLALAAALWLAGYLWALIEDWDHRVARRAYLQGVNPNLFPARRRWGPRDPGLAPK